MVKTSTIVLALASAVLSTASVDVYDHVFQEGLHLDKLKAAAS